MAKVLAVDISHPVTPGVGGVAGIFYYVGCSSVELYTGESAESYSEYQRIPLALSPVMIEVGA